MLGTVLELLVGMGYKHREAQALCDRVATHVGRRAKVEEVLTAALRAAPVPRGTVVREQVARYERLVA